MVLLISQRKLNYQKGIIYIQRLGCFSTGVDNSPSCIEGTGGTITDYRFAVYFRIKKMEYE